MARFARTEVKANDGLSGALPIMHELKPRRYRRVRSSKS